VRKLPIRLKLTLAFAVAMAVVLTATGLFVYLRLASTLQGSVDQNLRSRAADITALIKQADSGLAQAGRNPLSEQGEGFAQILDTRRRTVDSTPGTSRPVLSPAELAHATHGTTLLSRDSGGETDPARILATPVRAQGRHLVVVAGVSTENQAEALNTLVTQLVIGGLVALLLLSLAGYAVAAAALRPVEAMRRRAAAISASEPGRRLPVQPARDEISRLGATLNEMLGRLESAFARERTFVADASHELRTPLAILKTELELAQRRGRTTAELTDALRSAAEETDRLSQLADDLLVIARSDRGRLPVRRSEIDLPALLADARTRFADRAATSHRAIAVGEGGPTRLVADPLRIQQALGNMIDNALRHGSGTVQLGVRASNGGVELHVVDSGTGFSEQFLPTAFERFSRGDGGRTQGGTGLGLAIVAAIATAHDGRASAANRPEGGADVWMTLPAGPVR
jgi:heavy metal sensor kinase